MKTTLFLRALIVLYAVARVLQVFPVPKLAVVALHVICPLLFALVHGARVYGWRNICVFIGIVLLVGNAFENASVVTGFPFGRYYFTDVMGPKIFHVPVLLGLAYVGMGYLSWTLARLLLPGQLEHKRLFIVPVIASFIMVSWDLSQEAVWATLVKAWIWVDGGSYFGVPLSNFAGWFLTVYVMYQLFALYITGRDASGSASLNTWRLPIAFYALSAAGNVLLLFTPQGAVSDATGAVWKVRDVIGTSALVSIFTMGAFAVLAGVRLASSEQTEVND